MTYCLNYGNDPVSAKYVPREDLYTDNTDNNDKTENNDSNDNGDNEYNNENHDNNDNTDNNVDTHNNHINYKIHNVVGSGALSG